MSHIQFTNNEGLTVYTCVGCQIIKEEGYYFTDDLCDNCGRSVLLDNNSNRIDCLCEKK